MTAINLPAIKFLAPSERPVTMVAARRLSAHERAPLWSLRVRGGELVSRSLVVIPSLYLAGAIALGVLLPAVDRGFAGQLLGIDAADAQSILEAVAAGMIAFAGLVVRSRYWSCNSARASTPRDWCMCFAATR